MQQGLEQHPLCLCVCSSSTWPPRAGLAWESDSDLKGPLLSYSQLRQKNQGAYCGRRWKPGLQPPSGPLGGESNRWKDRK